MNVGHSNGSSHLSSMSHMDLVKSSLSFIPSAKIPLSGQGIAQRPISSLCIYFLNYNYVLTLLL